MKYISKLCMLFVVISLSGFSFAKKPNRAPRTDAPADNAAIEPVPPFVCDLTQIDRLLAQIKNEVTITNNALACSNEIAITGPAIISTPGKYCLKESFVFNSGDGIVINSDNVRLNLNQNIIDGNGAGDNGIVVNGSNVFIHNGFVNSVVGDAIQIGNGQTKVVIENVTVDPSTNGFALRGISGSPVTNCTIDNCNLVGTSTAITILFGQNNTVKNCNIAQATGAGILIDHGSNNIIRDSVIHDLQSFDGAESTTVAGIFTGTSESQCQIFGCEISDIIATGSAHPYGILFTNTLDVLNTVTNQFHGDTVFSVNWSPDGRYLAMGGFTVNGVEVRVYEFNGTSLTQVAFANHGAAILSVSWSPDGRYLAIGGNANTDSNEVAVYEFNGANLDSGPVGFAHGASIRSVNWSPDGRFLAIGGNTSVVDNFEVRVVEFDGFSLVDIGANFAHGASVRSVNWSSDSHFLAIGGQISGGFEVRVLEFNGSLVDIGANFAHDATVFSVNWSPDERFLAIGGDTPGDTFEVRVLEFNGSLVDIGANFAHGNAVLSVNWSADGRFLAIGGNPSPVGNFEIRVLEFNGTALAEIVNGFSHGATILSVNWSPTGQYVAMGGNTNLSSIDIRVLSGLTFAQNCIIRDNQISNVSGGAVFAPGFARGRSISATSGSNLIIQNAAFNCDINYEFVTNVFRQFLVNVNSTVPNGASNLSYPPL